jgi:ribosome-binding factor A
MTERRRGGGRRAGSPTGSHRYPRTARVGEVLRQVIAEELERSGGDDVRLALLTVTGVDVDPDLRHAKVWLSSMGEGVAEALAERRIGLQAAVARQVRLKYTPQLAFAADPAVERGNRIEDIIRAIDSGGDPGREEPGG